MKDQIAWAIMKPNGEINHHTIRNNPKSPIICFCGNKLRVFRKFKGDVDKVWEVFKEEGYRCVQVRIEEIVG